MENLGEWDKSKIIVLKVENPILSNGKSPGALRLTGLGGYCLLKSMKFIADLHIHSHFSRATSKNLDPEHIALWAQKKGIGVVGTGDFTHSGWIAELREKLIEAEDGLYRLKPDLQKAIDNHIPSSCSESARSSGIIAIS